MSARAPWRRPSIRASSRRSSARASPRAAPSPPRRARSEEHTSELQSPCNLVCRLLLEKKKNSPPEPHPIAYRFPLVVRPRPRATNDSPLSSDLVLLARRVRLCCAGWSLRQAVLDHLLA